MTEDARTGDPRQARGREAEARARAHLDSLGYHILAANHRIAGVEVDILAQDGDTLVVVEVKSRSTTRFGAPSEAVNAAKRRRLLRAGTAALARASRYPSSRSQVAAVRFDVISVVESSKESSLEHIRDAFDAGL